MKGSQGDPGSGEEVLGVSVADNLGQRGIGEAGDEVADVVAAGEGRHGEDERAIARPLGLVVGLVPVEGLVEGAIPGADTAADGRVVAGAVRAVRIVLVLVFLVVIVVVFVLLLVFFFVVFAVFTFFFLVLFFFVVVLAVVRFVPVLVRCLLVRFGWLKHPFWGRGQACPRPQDKNQNFPEKEKVSGMCPV
ncbi:MAG: hypothetical protein ABSF23_16770 [Terracidiphilus sp.]